MTQGETLAMSHELVDGLAWKGLRFVIHPEEKNFEEGRGFRSLLKVGDLPLILYREAKSGPQILLNFDFDQDEIRQSSALMVLLHRCLEACRVKKQAFSRINSECYEKINISEFADLDLMVKGADSSLLKSGLIRLPAYASFFSLSHKKGEKVELLLEGACGFADAAEADFSKAVKFNGLQESDAQATVVLRESDFLKPLWIMLLLICTVLAWILLERKQKNQSRLPSEHGLGTSAD